MSVVVCGGTAFLVRRIRWCPSCKARRRHVTYEAGIWYAPTTVCCTCGFGPARGKAARRRDAAKAREDWSIAADRAAWMAWMRDELRFELGGPS